MKKEKSRYIMIFILGFVLGFICFWKLFYKEFRIPLYTHQQIESRERMKFLYNEILRYVNSKGVFPKKLSDLGLDMDLYYSPSTKARYWYNRELHKYLTKDKLYDKEGKIRYAAILLRDRCAERIGLTGPVYYYCCFLSRRGKGSGTPVRVKEYIDKYLVKPVENVEISERLRCVDRLYCISEILRYKYNGSGEQYKKLLRERKYSCPATKAKYLYCKTSRGYVVFDSVPHCDKYYHILFFEDDEVKYVPKDKIKEVFPEEAIKCLEEHRNK